MNLDLFTQAAAHLAGRPVTIRWQAPVYDYLLSDAYRTREGGAIVDIYPELNREQIWAKFLYEIARIRLDWATMKPSDIWKRDPGSLREPTPNRQLVDQMPQVRAADRLAATWQKHAQAQAWRYERTDRDRYDMHLLALCDYYPSETVKRAVKSALAGLKRGGRK